VFFQSAIRSRKDKAQESGFVEIMSMRPSGAFPGLAPPLPPGIRISVILASGDLSGRQHRLRSFPQPGHKRFRAFQTSKTDSSRTARHRTKTTASPWRGETAPCWHSRASRRAPGNILSEANAGVHADSHAIGAQELGRNCRDRFS
jgi:hypothetical protein